jgi:catalase
MHMITWLFSPWGIPASDREMRGSGVHAYKWVNAAGEAVLVKYHFIPEAGQRNLTQAQAQEIQATNFNHATQEVFVQIMEDGEHPELDLDPLDATKIWPPELVPLQPIGRIVLDRNPANYFAEVEQVAFGTGVMVEAQYVVRQLACTSSSPGGQPQSLGRARAWQLQRHVRRLAVRPLARPRLGE